jgi:hypothetical protein
VHFRNACYSLGFELATCIFTFGLGTLHPALSGTGILTGTAGSSGCAGAGALARVDVKTFAGFFTRSSAHGRDGKHGGGGRGKCNSGSLLGCNHWLFPQVNLVGRTVFNRYASLEESIFQKVHKKIENWQN